MESVAVCLFGISYNEYYKHWCAGSCYVDYRRSLENYREKIFKHLMSYDVYYSTFEHPLMDELRKDYNTKDGIAINNEIMMGLTIDSSKQRNSLISNLEEMLLETNKEWYIFTRFDLNFNFGFDELNISKDHINVLTTLERPNYICDNLYIVGREKIREFFGYMKGEVISTLNRHDVNFFGGMNNIHLMRYEDGLRNIGQLEGYKIVRVTSQKNEEEKVINITNNIMPVFNRKKLEYGNLRKKL